MKKVLVTGAAGYIGSVLVRQLLKKGYFVRAFDKLNFGGESLIGVYSEPNFEFIKGDVREEQELVSAIKDIDVVVHLAAIVGDPACAKEPELAKETNWAASKMFFDICNASSNVKNFIFASTCSNYGKMETEGYVSEISPLKPVSLYAELKIKFEKYLLESNIRSDFVPTPLRFSTVYGLSNRLRFDLTVNEFVRDVTMGKTLKIFGEQFWRPYCHVQDLARSCVLVMESDPQKVRQNVFNVGDTRENYQKKMIAEEILKVIPDAKIEYVHKEEDPRDYRVDFTKIKSVLGYGITRTVPEGIKEINSILQNGLILDPYSKKYSNI